MTIIRIDFNSVRIDPLTFWWQMIRNCWQMIWWHFCYSSNSKSNTNSLKSVIDVTVSKIGDTDGNQSGESGVTCDDFEDGDKVGNGEKVGKVSVDKDDKTVDNGDKTDEIGDGNESESSYEYEEIEIEVTDSEDDSSSDSDEISKNNSNSIKISASERETSMASIRKIFKIIVKYCWKSWEFFGSFRGVFGEFF